MELLMKMLNELTLMVSCNGAREHDKPEADDRSVKKPWIVIDWQQMSEESPEAKMGKERDSISMFPF